MELQEKIDKIIDLFELTKDSYSNSNRNKYNVDIETCNDIIKETVRVSATKIKKHSLKVLNHFWDVLCDNMEDKSKRKILMTNINKNSSDDWAGYKFQKKFLRLKRDLSEDGEEVNQPIPMMKQKKQQNVTN